MDTTFNDTSTSLGAINPRIGGQNFYKKQSTSSNSMDSPCTEYSQSPSPHMMIQSQQNETPLLPTFTSTTNQNQY